MTETVEEEHVLDPETLEFVATEGGVLSLRIGEEFHPRVHLYRAFPLTDCEMWISVRDGEDKEIGVIERLDGLSDRNRRLVIEELDRRYFSPVIEQIHSLTDEFGYTYWDVSTAAGRTKFTVQVGHNAATEIGDDRVLLTDVEGNRFELRDFAQLAPKHRRIIELLM